MNAIGENRHAGKMNAISVYNAFQSYKFSSIINIHNSTYIYIYIYITIYIQCMCVYEYVCTCGERVILYQRDKNVPKIE